MAKRRAWGRARLAPGTSVSSALIVVLDFSRWLLELRRGPGVVPLEVLGAAQRHHPLVLLNLFASDTFSLPAWSLRCLSL